MKYFIYYEVIDHSFIGSNEVYRTCDYDKAKEMCLKNNDYRAYLVVFNFKTLKVENRCTLTFKS